ncbi:UNVERIFIED_CONTAM: hypothetical protein K2H54_030785, partial [Gekko kuhli]
SFQTSYLRGTFDQMELSVRNKRRILGYVLTALRLTRRNRPFCTAALLPVCRTSLAVTGGVEYRNDIQT